MDGLDLAAQIVGHGRARGFVLGVDVVTEGGAFGVEHTHRMVAGVFAAQALQHIDHAADRARGLAGRVVAVHPQIGHGMKSAVQIAGTVNQQQGGCVLHGKDCAYNPPSSPSTCST